MRNLSGCGLATVHRHRGGFLRLEARPCPPDPPRPPDPSDPPDPPVPSALVGPVVLLCWLARSLPRVRYKILPARLHGGENGTKLSLHARIAPNWAISGERGEFCTGNAVRGACWVARCVGSKPGQALPPPTGTAARPTNPFGALHTCGAGSLIGGSARFVTNVVNPTPFSLEILVFRLGLTTFVTGAVEGCFKMRQFDDVCNAWLP